MTSVIQSLKQDAFVELACLGECTALLGSDHLEGMAMNLSEGDPLVVDQLLKLMEVVELQRVKALDALKALQVHMD